MGHPLRQPAQAGGMTPPPVIIFHETDGRKYYRIVETVCAALNLPPPLYREIVVTKRLGRTCCAACRLPRPSGVSRTISASACSLEACVDMSCSPVCRRSTCAWPS
ncbi:hypothetical protein [Hankyongella ginsenosidimutans]|uniref:hypothetical protein n=1 Tax=Hankyongella ginsenosidimutans TaxID=1763828 RepID=UPI001CA363A3|nr:hypothetical protein [Hankyongella ginsenosidimutans]